MVHVIEAAQPYTAVTLQTGSDRSFQLVYDNEKLLIDAAASLKQDGKVLARTTTGEAALICDRSWENLRIIAADDAKAYAGSVEKAVRVWILDLPHQIVTVDIVKAAGDVTLYTQFGVNNHDGELNIHEYSQQRLVFRRGGQGFKLFELLSLTDGLPVSAALDRTLEGPIVGYSWEDQPGKAHLRVHTYSMDTSEAIPRWHVKLLEGNVIRMEYPGAEDWWDVLAEPDRITVTCKNGKQEVILL